MITWYDRFKGELVKKLPFEVVSGRYITNDECVFNGHTSIRHGDFLLDDGTERFHIESDVGSFIQHDKSEQLQAELQIIENAIIAYQETVDSDMGSSFLIPDKLLARFELTKFEELLFDVLKKGHLQEIARRPRMELIYEEHLVPVSRAKKVAASANAHLASHSECWQTKTLTGVIPKQILALESDDHLNIYENRVYVKLLGYIEQYLVKRVLEVKKLEDIFRQALNFQDAESIYFELRESVFSLWGEGFSDNTQADNGVANGATTREVLTKMLKTIRTLQHSSLYLSLTDNIHVPLKLNMTNVLSHDQHYRHVARLWNSWLDTQLATKLDPEQIFLRNKKLANAYSLYCSDLVKRTLCELAFNETSSNHFERIGSPVIRFRLTDSSEIILKTENQSLCFVPCFTNNPIETGSREVSNEKRVLLSLCQDNYVGNNICASPTNFYSLEQIAVLISEWLVNQTYTALGQTVTKVPKSLVEMLHNNNSDGYWQIENNKLTQTKPCQIIKPRLLEFKQKHCKDTSVHQAVDNTIDLFERFEAFLHCPCCGIKTDESQWISRDDNCFSIRNSNCNHSWAVNRQANGVKVLSISPIKSVESGTAIEVSHSSISVDISWKLLCCNVLFQSLRVQFPAAHCGL